MDSNKKSAPEIRFPGFTDPWEQRKLRDLVSEVKRTDANSDAPIMMITANDGFINQSERYSTENAGQSLKKYILLRKGELAYNHGASKLRPYGSCFALRTEEARIPFVYHCFSTSNSNPDFLSIVLNGKATEKQLRRIVSSGARMDGLLNISYDDYTSIPVMIPSLDEQNKIAACFAALDDAITLHQRKCDELKIYKKGLLQQMFPLPGEAFPRVRFPGFTNPWEQRKFGEITDVRSASRVHREEWTDAGVPFYRSSDVMAALNGTENEKAFISEELYEKLSSVSGKLEKGDVLVTGGGSVGNPYIVPDNSPLYTKDADLLWIKHSERLDPYFVYEFFFSPVFRNYLGSVSHVGTIAHYTITQLSETPISIPSIEEQRKIGKLFENLDHAITLHQRKCDELNIYKKGLLQKMFV